MIILRQVEIVVILYAINLMVRKKMKLSEASRSLPGHASIIFQKILEELLNTNVLSVLKWEMQKHIKD